MDTTRVEILGKEVEKIISAVSKQPSGLSSGEVALIAATIGASAAIITQLVVFFLTRFKEKDNLKKSL